MWVQPILKTLKTVQGNTCFSNQFITYRAHLYKTAIPSGDIPVYTNRSMWVQPILKTLKTARQHMFFKRRPPLQLKSVYHISCSSTQQPSQTVIPVYTHRSMWVQPILKTLKTARQQVFLRCEPPEAFLL